MTVDEFLVWAEEQPGRFELNAGVVFSLSPERARHVDVKFAIQTALANAIRRSRLTCRMMADGITARIDGNTAYERDALVYCGPQVNGDDVEIQNPVIIVEVTSPSTKSVDAGAKFIGYFRLPSVRHYLIVDPDRRVAVHHRHGEGEDIASRIVSSGRITFDPPGFDGDIAEFFAAE